MKKMTIPAWLKSGPVRGLLQVLLWCVALTFLMVVLYTFDSRGNSMNGWYSGAFPYWSGVWRCTVFSSPCGCGRGDCGNVMLARSDPPVIRIPVLQCFA